MDLQELKNMSENQLQKILQEKREELRDLRFKVSEEALKNVRSVRKVKKTIARILTLLSVRKDKKEEKPLDKDMAKKD